MSIKEINRAEAEKLYKLAVDELNEIGYTSMPTYHILRQYLDRMNKKELEYFRMINNKFTFNAGRWEYIFFNDN